MGSDRQGWAPSDPQSLCVLVVDDNPVNLALAAELLSCLGIQVMLAGDGAEAVALASELRVDLILMDLQMPVLDGLAATRQLRGIERAQSRARVPVMAYTSLSNAAHQPWRDSGLGAVLEKPCDLLALEACVARWCPPRSSAGQPGH